MIWTGAPDTGKVPRVVASLARSSVTLPPQFATQTFAPSNVRIPLQRNLEKAAYWYKKAYKSGDDCGALNLAIDRRKQGNIRSAVIWFKISSTSRTRENGQRGSGGASARAFSPECT